ncbi:uncharacterized protein sS8_4634 [Methylocaldum marinum]|uniref:Uncharacterized protein n=1 Tax=Methylocaldum marinum TaxID=1432792 RepID=A0A250KYJ9_9GAMM|nr:hypothetical protein [Methylocaldum marinum]BBA36564.1 uncharacterized protein sS8_4634 [Methylocaldum marinum]
MIAMTWVELLLTGLFFGSVAFSIGFCISNYEKIDVDKDDLGLIKRAAK